MNRKSSKGSLTPISEKRRQSATPEYFSVDRAPIRIYGWTMKSVFTAQAKRETNGSPVFGLTTASNCFQPRRSFNSTDPCRSHCTVTIPSRPEWPVFPAPEPKLITMQKQIGQPWQTQTRLFCVVFQAVGKGTGALKRRFMTVETVTTPLKPRSSCSGQTAWAAWYLEKKKRGKEIVQFKIAHFPSDCDFRGYVTSISVRKTGWNVWIKGCKNYQEFS